jgi:hypothetical protein
LNGIEESIMTYLLISVIAFNAVAFIVPKHLKKQEIYSTALLSLSLGLLVDSIFSLKYNLYGYFHEGVQYSNFLVNIGLFPAAGVLFLNFYPVYNKSFIKKMTYFIFWVAFCLFYEWTALKSGFFYYNGWNLWYSALTYPILLWIHILHLFVFQKLPKI